jgi:hypothetical protein
MSTNVGFAGFSLKLNEEDQSEERLREIATSLGYVWKDNDDFDEIVFNEGQYMGYQNCWKPHMDYDGKYGVIWVTQYEYDASDIDFQATISAMGKALKAFIDQTYIIPKEEIKAFAIVYYNGVDCTFKF